MTDVKITGLAKRFGTVDVLQDIDLQVNSGEFVVLVGPSGCGKSTLLRMIAGLETIETGTVRIDGQVVNQVEADQRGIAMVFQSYALYPHMTVGENIGFCLIVAGEKKDVIASKVLEVGRTLQIEHLLDRKPGELSGGQRQRVAIGRAIVRNPRVFLFDEPLSNLDAELRVQMRLELAKLHNRLQATMIYVTHDQTEAMPMADKIVIMNNGRLEQIGTPIELFNNPCNQFVAGFIGTPKMNFLEARVAVVAADTVQLDLSGHSLVLANRWGQQLQEGMDVTLGVRPAEIGAAYAGGPMLKGSVNVVEQLGRETLTYLILAGGVNLAILETGQHNHYLGQEWQVCLNPDAVYLFDRQGLTIPATVVAELNPDFVPEGEPA